jgi:L-ascorbate metabolism protein UlaG (beta-lactamase superfamily)
MLERSAPWPQVFPSPFEDVPPERVGDERCRIAHIGHASFLIQTRGHNILIDPVYAERASPLTFLGPRRVNPPGIDFDRLPPIDTILVTHNHYDHLDTGTLARLWTAHKPRIITPLGNDTIMRGDVPGIVAQAVDWGARIDLAPGLEVFAEPTQHWSARGLGDRSHALWASFVIHSGDKRVYCVGDTGFGDGRIFREIAARHAPIDLALLPIGAYEPRWFMQRQHINPDEAVEAMTLSGARRAVGHHWGTFQLTTEPIDQPPADLAAALRRRNKPLDSFVALRPGQVVEI